MGQNLHVDIALKPWVWGGLLLVALSGCDLGVYGARYRDRLPELQRRSELNRQIHSVYSPLQSADGRSLGAEIRFPVLFDAETIRYSAGDLATKPDQAQPPRIPVPGLLFSYEKFVATPGGEALPVYAYVGAGDANVDLATLQAEIEQSAEAIVSDDLQWEQVNLKTFKGETVTWQRLRISAAQPFVVGGPSGTEKPTLEGQLLYFVKTHGNSHIILVWRYPSQLADQIGFPAAIEASVASLK